MNDFETVSRACPCPICGHDSWCAVARDGSAIMCMRHTTGSDGVTRELADHTPYGLHFTGNSNPGGSAKKARHEPPVAPPELRHKAYSALLDALSLSDVHVQHLRVRGLSPAQVEALREKQIRTLPDDGARTAALRAAITALGGGEPLTIPGIHRGQRGWRFSGRAGLLIPVRDAAGQIVALKLRPDDPGTGGKYVWITSTPFGGPGPGALTHVARASGSDSSSLRIVEGVLKAEIAAQLDPSHAVIGLPSCNAISTARDALLALKPQRVLLAWDGDARSNRHVASGLERAITVTRELLPSAEVAVETWDSAHKGIDDALAAGATIAANPNPLEALAAIRGAAPGESKNAKRAIQINTEEHEVNDAALDALASEDSVYTRGASLVRVVCDTSPVDPRPPRIEAIPQESLREILTRHVDFESFSRNAWRPAHPPAWCVAALHRRGTWPGLRPLVSVLDAPVLRRDGTVLTAPGYDRASGCFFEPRFKLPEIPERPTPEQGSDAMARLVDILEEFPFDSTGALDEPVLNWQINLAAAIALPLTLVARPMIAGPVPGWLIDAPDAGAGKTLLAKVCALLGTGSLPDAERWHEDEDEWAKVHLGNLLEGRRVVFFDNLTTGGVFGHGALDGALTQWPLWKGRILGQTGNVSVRNDVLVVATGNNPRIPGDTIRRLVRVRLRPDEERRAESDREYRHRLPGDAVKRAPELIAAALTALRAWIVARPAPSKLVAWGSFEEWAAIVPQCLAWYGYPDIHHTQDGLRVADDGAEAVGQLALGWDLLVGAEGASPAEVITMLRGPLTGSRSVGAGLIRQALEALDPKRIAAQHNPWTLGRLLAKFEGKIVRGRRIVRSAHKGNGARWVPQALEGAPSVESVLEAVATTERASGEKGVSRGFEN